MVVDERNMLDHILSREDAYKALVEWIPNGSNMLVINTTSIGIQLADFLIYIFCLLSEEDILQCK